jgi:hypothetical protein
LLRFGTPFLQRFYPYFTNLLSAAGALYAWIYVISLKKIFSARKKFEIYSQMYQRKKLQQVLYEDSSFLQYTDESINSQKSKYLVQLAFIAALTIFCAVMNVSLPPGLYILLAVMFFAAVSIFSFLEIIKWEHYYSAEGISLSAQDRVKRILAAGIISFICLTAALVTASQKSVLPFSLITGFLLWLLSLFRSDREYVPEEIPEFKMGMDMPQSLMPFAESAAEEPSVFFELLKEILKYGFIILAIALFILFMISPLLNRGKMMKNLTFREKLVRIIRELFKGIISGFVSFFAYLKSGRAALKLRKHDPEDIKRAAENLLNAYSMIKKSDVKRSAALFARLIVWGYDVRNVKWQPHHAPAEFCGILIQASAQDSGQDLRQINEGVIRCGEIFEKALYSFEALSVDERNEFKNLIEEITSSSH